MNLKQQRKFLQELEQKQELHRREKDEIMKAFLSDAQLTEAVERLKELNK